MILIDTFRFLCVVFKEQTDLSRHEVFGEQVVRNSAPRTEPVRAQVIGLARTADTMLSKNKWWA